MTDLSPAALSVWCRFCEVVEEHGPPRLGLAAALRAAADQCAEGLTHFKLYVIAAELEGHG